MPVATAEPDGSSQLAKEELPFGLGLREPLRVAQLARFLDVLVDLDEPSPVCRLRLLVQERSRIARLGEAWLPVDLPLPRGGGPP